MLTVKRCGRFHKQSKKMVNMCKFAHICMVTFGFQRVRASGEAESRDMIVWRQTARRDAKLWRVDRNCASHKWKKTNKPATVRDEQTIDIQ
jgi:hypothetical protein